MIKISAVRSTDIASKSIAFMLKETILLTHYVNMSDILTQCGKHNQVQDSIAKIDILATPYLHVFSPDLHVRT